MDLSLLAAFGGATASLVSLAAAVWVAYKQKHLTHTDLVRSLEMASASEQIKKLHEALSDRNLEKLIPDAVKGFDTLERSEVRDRLDLLKLELELAQVRVELLERGLKEHPGLLHLSKDQHGPSPSP